jgi:riboflavin kinase/FMN adenylyltransferase
VRVIDLKSLKAVTPELDAVAIALGCFDGVHIGHADIIRMTVDYAVKNGIKSAVWTFDNKLTGTLSRVKGAPCITTLEEKLAQISTLGVDYAILVEFTEVKSLSPEKFVRDVLCRDCGCVYTVCGFNFRFGAEAKGDGDMLIELMRENGGDGIIVPPVMCGTKVVSSTLVRECITHGDMEMAARLLGRGFSIDFPVVRGHQLGRKIGIPTINQDFPSEHIIPKNGIYACLCDVDGSSYLAVANVGCRPTVSDGSLKINCETHIINYSGFLYDKRIRVVFYHRLRDEKKFDSVDELRQAIHSDIDAAREYFSKM